MLPLGILRSVTPPAQVAWRIALYRVSVDGGMFAGPFVAGLLPARHAGVLPAALIVVMATVGVALLAAARYRAVAMSRTVLSPGGCSRAEPEDLRAARCAVRLVPPEDHRPAVRHDQVGRPPR